MNNIIFISEIIPSYKVWIYEALAKKFGEEFIAVHGNQKEGKRPNDTGLSGNFRHKLIRNIYFNIKGIDLSYSPVFWWILMQKPKIVILQDGVRILSNYLIHFVCKLVQIKVFYYSHGYNHQASQMRGKKLGSITEKIRIFMLKKSDLVLVYSSKGEEYLKSKINVRIVNTHNTLDTKAIINASKNIEVNEKLYSKHNLSNDKKYIIFFGRLIKEKEIPLFCEIIYGLNKIDPSIEGIIIGDGPELNSLKNLFRNGVIYKGPKFGIDLYEMIKLSKLVFIPGMVGLAIVDSFCIGRPLYTIDHDFHSPEIEYLEDDKNGKLMENNKTKIINILLKDMLDPGALKRMSEKALDTAYTKCSSERMFEAFNNSISSFLK